MNPFLSTQLFSNTTSIPWGAQIALNTFGFVDPKTQTILWNRRRGAEFEDRAVWLLKSIYGEANVRTQVAYTDSQRDIRIADVLVRNSAGQLETYEIKAVEEISREDIDQAVEHGKGLGGAPYLIISGETWVSQKNSGYARVRGLQILSYSPVASAEERQETRASIFRALNS